MRLATPRGPVGPVGIVGLGALGGSLARALGRLPHPPEVRGWARDAADLEAAVEAGVLEAGKGIGDVAGGAAWLVVATPMGATEAVLREAAGTLAGDARVLDVGSLQGPALTAAAEAGLADRFVACHPMAGSEASGFEASRAELFQDATVWLSVGGGAAEALGPEVEAFWSALGARPEWTEPEIHDARMVVASHLPQLVANALAEVIAEGGFAVEDLGPGGLDMTRLAASDPLMWRDLLTHSGPQAAALLRLTARALDGWARTLDGDDLDEVERRMAATRAWRGK